MLNISCNLKLSNKISVSNSVSKLRAMILFIFVLASILTINCVSNINEITNLGLEIIGNPDMCVFAIKSPCKNLNIFVLADKLEYNENKIVLAGNGSVIRNDFFRKALNEELRFNFTEIKWTFSSISPAYGAGILAARLYDVTVKVSDIVKGNAIVSA